jgi:hypothetical protein
VTGSLHTYDNERPTFAKENTVPDPIDAWVTVTWTHVETYRQSFPAGVIADAAGLPVEVLLADPAMLSGVVNPATAEVLKAAQNDAVRRAPTEIEIIDPLANHQSALIDLFDQARRLIREETDSGSPADHGLAALIAGLRREGLIS